MTVAQEEYVFEFSGGELCLDFANTASARFQATPREHLHGYRDLVAWGRQGEVVAPAQATELLAEAARRPGEADAVYGRAIALREAIFRTFARREVALPPTPEDLATLNAELASAMAHTRLVPTTKGFDWAWREGAGALDRPLWPVARSAAELLTSEALDRVRECGADDCDWLFVDTSKNRSRRWCDMNSCGNRAKARRHYEKKRAAPGEPG
jgi:predicted RNA-binding Zn ribbon-like protein